MGVGHGWHFHRSVYPVSARRGTAAVLLIFVIVSCAGAQNSKSKGEGLEFRNAAPGVRYVGSDMCRGCHSAIYQQHSRTDMAHSTSLPRSILDKGWLAKPVDIFNQKLDRHYQVFARDGKVYQSEYGLDQQGKEVFRHTEELAYVVGTGANGVTPIIRRDNYLFQAPVSYYTEKKKWDLSPNYEEHDLGFSLPVTADCIGCHIGRTQPVKDREGLYEDPPVVQMGINCERCHGPGELHVNERLAGKPVSGAIDRSIVNPAKLPPWLADNICMNCHEGDIRALQPGNAEADFRPGTPLKQPRALAMGES